MGAERFSDDDFAQDAMVGLKYTLIFALLWSAAAAAVEWTYDIGVPTADCSLRLEAAARHGQTEYLPWVWDPWTRKALQYGGFFLRRKEYESVREVALAVHGITRGSPVIGLGRSPAAIIAILSILEPDLATNLPITDFRSRPEGVFGELPAHYLPMAKKFEPLSPEVEGKLFAHFDETVLTFLRSRRGKVYLLDLGESGASAFAVTRYLDRYARARGIPVSFEPVLFTTPFFSPVIDQMGPCFGLTARKIVFEASAFIEDILKRLDRTSAQWKRHAPYGEFNLQLLHAFGTTVYDPWSGYHVEVGQGKPNRSHGRFKTALYANMLFDPLFAEYKLRPLALGVPGVTWDPVGRVYRDQNGEMVPLSTGN